MTHARPIFFSAAEALRSTFCTSIESRGSQIAKSRTVLRQLRYYNASYRPVNLNTRSPATLSATGSRSLRPSPQYPPRPRRTPGVDEGIQSNVIQIAGQDGGLEDPISLRDALNSLDRTLYFLRQVAPEAEGRYAICRIFSKQEAREKEREKTKPAKKSTSIPTKKIELNWCIDPHDLSHRLGQMQSFLEKGKRVELVLIRKKGKRRATEEEAKGLLEKVRGKINEIGAVEVKPMNGVILRHVEFTLDAKPRES